MRSRTRSRQEVVDALLEQRKALRASIASYDAGETWEAKRLAVTAHTILHDGGRHNISILSQLGIRGKIKFADTTIEISEGFQLAGTRLVFFALDDEKASYIAPFSEGKNQIRQYVGFNEWYDEYIFANSAGFKFTRKNLIFALRSQDGGAHFDPKLKDNPYLHLSSAPGTDFKVKLGGVEVEELGAHLASMRQIAGELEITLDKIPAEML